METSDWISIFALGISLLAIWRSESTAKDQLASEVFVAANAIISITTEAFRVANDYIEATSTLPNNFEDESQGLLIMQRVALDIVEKDLSKSSRNELRDMLTKTKADKIHAERILNKYKEAD